MKTEYKVLAVFIVIFIVVIALTAVMALSFSNKTRQNDIVNPDTNQVNNDYKDITNGFPETLNEKTNKIIIEQIKSNNFIDLSLTNIQNISGIEVGIKLPQGLKRVELKDKALFDDIFDNFDETKSELKIGALSNQVVSPKTGVKFVRIYFDKPIETELEINYQIILDQNGNAI
jgi:hypothetical protein